MPVNYIFITGGVMSGLGKGIAAASIGKILQWHGLKVTAMKLDGYLNFDAGTLRPTEHGEVWVTEDGGEIDEDLGHYERFLGTNMPKTNCITSGQIYWQVIKNERDGKYLGKTVQLIPHVTDEIKRRIKEVAKSSGADVVLVEIGGTVGDYENSLFIEAARQMNMNGDKAIYVHLSYLPVPSHIGEQKTKPTQASVKDLLSMGIQPDMIIGRSETPIDNVRKEKIAQFCNISKDDVFSDHDIDITYELPMLLKDQGMSERLLKKFNIPATKADSAEWENYIKKIKGLTKPVKIGVVGKYFGTGDYQLTDSYISVIESVKHAAWNNDLKPIVEWVDAAQFEKDNGKLKNLNQMDGIIIPGGYGSTGVEGKIAAIQFARENDIPMLGLCYGLQLAVIEYARNVAGMEGANTTEIDKNTPYPVIDLLPWQKKILENSDYGATMRLGDQAIKIVKNTLAHKIYRTENIVERFRHRYEVNPEYVDKLEKSGFIFSGHSEKENIKQIGEIEKHRYFLGTQYHGEFTSKPMKPNPTFDGLIKAAME